MPRKTSPKNKLKKGIWFKRVRGSYLPVSWQGWLTYIPFVAYLLFSFTVGCRDTQSYTLAALFIAPNWIAALVVMTWVAGRKS